jgi:hypothetical protein
LDFKENLKFENTLKNEEYIPKYDFSLKKDEKLILGTETKSDKPKVNNLSKFKFS